MQGGYSAGNLNESLSPRLSALLSLLAAIRPPSSFRSERLVPTPTSEASHSDFDDSDADPDYNDDQSNSSSDTDAPVVEENEGKIIF